MQMKYKHGFSEEIEGMLDSFCQQDCCKLVSTWSLFQTSKLMYLMKRVRAVATTEHVKIMRYDVEEDLSFP